MSLSINESTPAKYSQDCPVTNETTPNKIPQDHSSLIVSSPIQNISENEQDLFKEARRILGLWPVKHNHITAWKSENHTIYKRNINEHPN